MLKLGIAYLNEGVYEGKRIVPEHWVEKSRVNFGNNRRIKVPISDFGRMGYAYSWWTDELKSPRGTVNVYDASGWGGQHILVMEDLDMVVVFTGGNYVVKSHHRKILERFVLPAIDD